ncbi:tuberin [Caerostris extrusa]|uniref:Tuberin n=1 Tax=Caerostris extrusa TaxID=172846 RepID=A0AAV4N5V2_CAEEX|nr:tuberin [Caerostris extrusa]
MLTDCNDSFHSYGFDLSLIQTARTCISFEFISSVRLFIYIKCIFTETKMSKKEKSLHEKMKNFFARKDTTPLNFEGMNVEPYVVSYEIMKDISSENNVNHRIKSLKDLYEHVVSKLLAQNVVEAICKQIEDLLSPNQSLETRHIVFQFFNGLIISQLDNLYITRSYFFRLIVTHKIPSDLMPRFEMFKALSQDGKQIKYFEEEIGPFLLSWFPDFVAIEKEAEFLALLVNVISHNAAYLDEVIIDSFINYINQLCSRSKKHEDVEESLKVLGAVVMFSHLPKPSLHKFICTLCITVNHEKFVSHSWEKMRYILGTYIGHTVIRYLCVVLEDINHHPDSRIVRGAVYFIGMALWGPNRVSSLTHPPAAIIPAFLKAVDRNSDIIAYEIILALKKLILDCGNQLVNRSLVWDDILEVVKRILLYPEFQGVSPSFSTYFQTVHNLITTLEEHCPEDSHENLYQMIDQCSHFQV